MPNRPKKGVLMDKREVLKSFVSFWSQFLPFKFSASIDLKKIMTDINIKKLMLTKAQKKDK